MHPKCRSMNNYMSAKSDYHFLSQLFQTGGDNDDKSMSNELCVLKHSYPSETYLPFFEKKTKSYYFIPKQDGFNMAVCKIDKNREIYCVRYLGTVPAYFGEEVIPGNFSGVNKKYMLRTVPDFNKKIGKNFFWNSWKDTLLDNTLFFVGHYKKGKIVIDEKIEPFAISNRTAFTNINEGTLKYADVRLCSVNGDIYCYDGLVTSIYQIKIIDNKIYIPLSMDDSVYSHSYFYFKNKLCDKKECVNIQKKDSACLLKTFDKNWSFVDIVTIEKNKFFEFVNWFVNGYVVITYIDMKSGTCSNFNAIKMKGDRIDGLGNDFLPMFSLGSPFIKIDKNDKNDKNVDYCGIAAGHTKIITTKKYESEKLNIFLKNVNKLREDNNYVEHNSYIYMCYFLKLTKYTNGNYEMHISDSFLFLDGKKEYIFSICFPMGMFEKKNSYVMTYGYGDYYNCMIKLEKKSFMKQIKHNVEDFDKNKYDFHMVDISNTNKEKCS
jgi:hypothetical protein